MHAKFVLAALTLLLDSLVISMLMILCVLCSLGIALVSKITLFLDCCVEQICVWSSEKWDKRTSRSLPPPTSRPPGTPPAPASAAELKVQFHNDQQRLLVCHEAQLAIMEAATLERTRHVSAALHCMAPTLSSWHSSANFVTRVPPICSGS